MQPAKFMRPENMCYISWAAQKRILLLQRPSHFSRGKTEASFRDFYWCFLGKHWAWLSEDMPSVDWMHEHMDEWRMAQTCLFKAQVVLQTPLSESISETFCFLKPPQFSLFLLLHGRSKTAADSLSFPAWNTLLSALLWGVKEGERRLREEGGHCDRFDQENKEDVSLAVSRAKPWHIAAFNSCLLEHSLRETQAAIPNRIVPLP